MRSGNAFVVTNNFQTKEIKMESFMKIGLVGAFFFIALTIGPWLLFWSIETIAAAAGFAVVIPFTFWTWLAHCF